MREWTQFLYRLGGVSMNVPRLACLSSPVCFLPSHSNRVAGNEIDWCRRSICASPLWLMDIKYLPKATVNGPMAAIAQSTASPGSCW
ncbi:hypothetical protein M419DRAFT_124848 [Trichoderma reesei RUT C-30]|uniref:Uncharacterized protein n=1 Tax=Hypocrea jecorina (strain ATCC 56765 / BCRC 32924 / NRRL 11460 / Rut C-30) TaxID=1344414 RepID=A0A024RYZ3_HYPJR|nr:hypothetical protein M419DRAFT_124848 [Trichoderma reesei RUT C-30]